MKLTNIFRAKRAAAGLTASDKPKAAASKKGAKATDKEETVAEGDEDETEASDEEEYVDAEGEETDEEKAPAVKKGAKKTAARADTSERARIGNILNSASGKALPSLAGAFAFNSGMSSASAIKFLDAAMKDIGGKPAASGKRSGAFRDAMAGGAPNPKSGFGSKNAGKSDEDAAIEASIRTAAEFGLAVPAKA